MLFKSVTVLDEVGNQQVELNIHGLAFSIRKPNGTNTTAVLRLEAGTDPDTIKLVVYRDGYNIPITLIDNIGA